MHRSGTSCLAGSLEEGGLELGTVDRVPHTNPKGNHENLKIMRLNNAVLEANGAAWDRPTEQKCVWSKEHCDWRDKLIASYPKDRLWGFKDPRTLLVLEGWLDGLPEARLVASFRHPIAVAQSLHRRNQLPISDGIALWESYNKKLLNVLETHPEIPIVCFDVSTEEYDSALQQVFSYLGLPIPQTRLGFFEPNLRRSNSYSDINISPIAQQIYDKLVSKSVVKPSEKSL